MKKRVLTWLTAVCMVLTMLPLPAAWAAETVTFSDVTDRNTAMAVETLRLMDVLDGYGDGTFRPEAILTRAQFCKMVVYAMGAEDELGLYRTVTVFPDVKPSHWAAGYINMAAKGKKVISGYPDGLFHPDQTVTTGQAVTILLMLTGGAPGSTAGGMKVTTLAVLIANAAAAFHRREDSRLFDRRLDYSAVRNAAAILLLYLSLTFVGAAVISVVEGLPLGACLYETASAAGTVGLTLGLTPQLGTLSQSILILLMFFGRVGGLTLIYAAFSGHDLTYARYPKEMITVG